MTPPAARPLDPGVKRVARTLKIDAVMHEVVTALRSRGVEPVLLKGPRLDELLYDASEPREYADVDLLVEPSRYQEALMTITALGFAPAWAPTESRRLPHACDLTRADGACVDLHRTLPGVRHLEPNATWRGLLDHIVPWRPSPGGPPLRTLDDPAAALVVALHVTHHVEHPDLRSNATADLDRAVLRLPTATWQDAARLAEMLNAALDLAHGLSVVPHGLELASRLGLPPASSGDQAPAGLERVLAAHGLAGRLAVLARALFPTPAHLRWVSPLARRGRVGLFAAYLERPLRLGRTLPPALRARARARVGRRRV